MLLWSGLIRFDPAACAADAITVGAELYVLEKP